MPITVAQIIKVSFESVKHQVFQGRGWATHSLATLARDGRVTTMVLGDRVELPDGRNFPVEALDIPMVWSKRDDVLSTENGKIAIARALMENVLKTHDLMLEERMGAGRAVVSHMWRYILNEPRALAHSTSMEARLYTLVAFTD